ncbi:hypothetical protein [Streptomyces rochei]|uniref:hypothetical protein n=1 Tax=Streptomyces rochei TaxID=1928 RepID=UPI0040642D96
MNNPDEFEQIVQGIQQNSTGNYSDPTPYGPPPTPTYTPAVKTGLTPRGKAAIGFGTAALACGALFGWQQYAAQQADADVKAQELALKQQQIQLEMQRELNKATTAAQEQQSTKNTEQKKQIDACVKTNQKLVGKLMGVTYQSIQDDCQAKYPPVTDASMQAAGSSTNTTSGDSGGLNEGLLIGAGVLGLIVVAGSRKLTKSSQT